MQYTIDEVKYCKFISNLTLKTPSNFFQPPENRWGEIQLVPRVQFAFYSNSSQWRNEVHLFDTERVMLD